MGGSTRRGFLAGTAGAGLGAALRSAPARAAEAHHTAAEAVAFFGQHQAGIATPSQEHLQFGAFDMVSDSVDDLRRLLKSWSAAAAKMCAGRPVGPVDAGDSPPIDTGEALGLGPARVTVTFGLGPDLFGTQSRDRFGLFSRLPKPLVNLPRFPRDRLKPGLCDGDLAVQVCADDPQVAFHALHDLARLARGVAKPRWMLAGSGRTGNSRGQPTPRNLMGFKDGTLNIASQDQRALDRFVWASGRESPSWMHGGTYMVARRIEIELADWDATPLRHQEHTVGRHKVSGAPLGGSREHDPINLGAQSAGSLVIPWNAHIRLASPEYNADEQMLRRGYSFTDGIDQVSGSLTAGQFFICFQRDPRAQFIPIQRRLARDDGLARFLRHVGSAIFACPPGARPGGFVGEGLFN